jgi:Fe-S cluster biogenesis protein NfuA
MQQDVQERQQRAERIEALIQEVSAFPDSHARATTEELIQALLDMYGEGLARILELIGQSKASGNALIETLANDDLVGSLFLLHGLHPSDIETRVSRALGEMRPYLKSHGGAVEFIKVESGIAYLRLEGSCQGCSASTLKQTVEETLYKAVPDLEGIQIEDNIDQPRAVKPITFVPRRRKEGASATVQRGN